MREIRHLNEFAKRKLAEFEEAYMDETNKSSWDVSVLNARMASIVPALVEINEAIEQGKQQRSVCELAQSIHELCKASQVSQEVVCMALFYVLDTKLMQAAQ